MSTDEGYPEHLLFMIYFTPRSNPVRKVVRLRRTWQGVQAPSVKEQILESVLEAF